MTFSVIKNQQVIQSLFSHTLMLVLKVLDKLNLVNSENIEIIGRIGRDKEG